MLRLVIKAIFTLLCCLVTKVQAHGRLMDPPARNSMWRLGFNNPVNYNDNELFCGGRMVQWLRNNGKCGVCGDPYHGNREHEAGGKYANGIVTRSYHEGDQIPVTVHLTANHLGWFEFRICPVNDPKTRVTQECLDKNVLERPDGKGMKFYVPKGKYNAFFNYTLQLPPGLTCKQCVMQWKYRTGNTWDKDTKSGLFCLGCGPQEEFYNCADVEILPRGEKSKWTKEKNSKQTTVKQPKGPPPTHRPGLSKSKFKPFTTTPKVRYTTRTVTRKPVSKVTKAPEKSQNDISVQKKTKNIVTETKREEMSKPDKTWMFREDNNGITLKRQLKHPDDSKYNWRASSDTFTWPKEKLRPKKKTVIKSRPQATRAPSRGGRPWVVETSKLRSVRRHRNPFYKYRNNARPLRIRVTSDVKKVTKSAMRALGTTDPDNCVTEKPKQRTSTLRRSPGITPRAKQSMSPFGRRFSQRYPSYMQQQINRRQNDVTVHRNVPPQPIMQPVLAQPQPVIAQPQPILAQPQPIIPHPQSTSPFVGQPQHPQTSIWYQYQPTFGYFWGRSIRPILKCRATMTLGGGMDEWCTANCNANFCPGAMCVCKTEPLYPRYSVFPQTLPWSKLYSQQLTNYNTGRGHRYPMAAVLRAQPQPQTKARNQVADRHVMQPNVVSPAVEKSPRSTQQTQRPAVTSVNRPNLENRIRRLQKQSRSIQRPHPQRKSTNTPKPVTKGHTQKVVPGSVYQKTVSTARLANQKKVVSMAGRYVCKATGRYTGLPQFDDWCHKNCMKIICPLLICECRAQ